MKKIFSNYKIIIILILVILVFLIAILGYADNSNKTRWLKNYLNQDFKNFLNKTLLYPLYLKKKIKFVNNKLLINSKKHEEMIFKIFENGFEVKKVKEKNIKINNNNLNFYKWNLPFFESGIYGKKPSFYLDKNQTNIFFISGSGLLFKFNTQNLEKDRIKIYNIKTNLIELINDAKFYHDAYLSIKDILIDGDYIYLSYSKKSKQDCYNTSLLRGKINEKQIEFEIIFDPKECSKINPVSGGGRIVKFDSSNFFLTIGDYFDWKSPQNINSIFGKIILLNIKDKKFKIVSMGHRNQQGLAFLKKENVLIATEHGPKGGDEINLINLNKNGKNNNFGWPISSYGVHYDGKTSKIAPLYKSHEDYGFIEPILHFTPSIGISEIVNVDNIFSEDKNYYHFFVSALGYQNQINEGDQSLHLIKLKTKNLKIDKTKKEKVILNERIRDMILINTQILLSLESTPALGLINKMY
tara:strand:- start:3983 stop:5389 length:1407 start_codon:yes stop_codon:yes gene_type:complete